MLYCVDIWRQIFRRLLVLTCFVNFGIGYTGWIYYECDSPDGVSPSAVNCLYSAQNINYKLDATTADIWCCQKKDWSTNLTSVTCPNSEHQCLGATQVRAKLDPNLVPTTYRPWNKRKPTSHKRDLTIAGVACGALASILVLGWCCLRRRSNTVRVDRHNRIRVFTTEQPRDPVNVTVHKRRDSHRVPSYIEATASPEPTMQGAPNNYTVPRIADPPVSQSQAGDPPPSYEEVTKSEAQLA